MHCFTQAMRSIHASGLKGQNRIAQGNALGLVANDVRSP